MPQFLWIIDIFIRQVSFTGFWGIKWYFSIQYETIGFYSFPHDAGIIIFEAWIIGISVRFLLITNQSFRKNFIRRKKIFISTAWLTTAKNLRLKIETGEKKSMHDFSFKIFDPIRMNVIKKPPVQFTGIKSTTSIKVKTEGIKLRDKKKYLRPILETVRIKASTKIKRNSQCKIAQHEGNESNIDQAGCVKSTRETCIQILLLSSLKRFFRKNFSERS